MYRITIALLALGMFHVQVHVTTRLVLLASPSAFLTRRMVDKIRGIDIAILPEDKYLQGYTGVQDVYQIP